MIDFSIREMEKKDIKFVLEIERESFNFPWSASTFVNQFLLKDISLNLVAVSDNTVMGYVILWFEGNDSHILNIAVGSKWRGKKIADKIIDYVINHSVKRGCNRIYLEVRKSNSYALNFYKRNGFDVIGEEKGYYAETGEDAMILELLIG